MVYPFLKHFNETVVIIVGWTANNFIPSQLFSVCKIVPMSRHPTNERFIFPFYQKYLQNQHTQKI